MSAVHVDSEEHWLLEVIAHLQAAHERAAKPYVDRLAAIRAVRPPPPLTVTFEEARELFPALFPTTTPGPAT